MRTFPPLMIAGLLLLAGCAGSQPATMPDAGGQTAATHATAYYVYVTAESEDEVALVRFDGQQAEVAKTIPVGVWPTEIEGPHGIAVSPDGEYWYVSLAHGNPYGKIYKYKTGTDELVGDVEVGLFPATMHISPLTGLLYVVNFNLHGDMVPSTLSVVEPESMVEIAQIPHGTMPHGSRMSPDGKYHYGVSMMSDELLEVDALSLEVTRRLQLGEGHSMAHHGTMPMDMSQPMDMSKKRPKPTWVQPHPTKPVAYVAYNGSNEIAEVDLEKWEVTRRFQTDKGPYNLDITADGKLLVVSYKGAGRTGIWDLEKGEELANLPNTRKVTHGVALSPDNRYAFVSAEGIGGEAGVVDVFDLQTLRYIDTAELGKQAGGIYFWKQE